MRAVIIASEQYKGYDPKLTSKELKTLAEGLGYDIKNIFIFKIDKPKANTYFGSGQLADVKFYLLENDIDIVILDDDIPPSALRNIEDFIEVKIITRTKIILEIFLKRAKTQESILEIKLEQAKYMLTHIDLYTNEGNRNKGGAFNSKGSGETERELLSRNIRNQIKQMERELESLKDMKKRQISRRKKNGLPIVSLVGYTNAGKSTIMNGLINDYNQNKANVYEKDELFATLATYSRELKINNIPYILVDTIGFISKLPTSLIHSFYTTLEEVKEADILLFVIDISDKNHLLELKESLETINKILEKSTRAIFILNKHDLYPQDKKIVLGNYLELIMKYDKLIPKSMLISSSKTEYGIQLIKKAIQKELTEDYLSITLEVPYIDGKTINFIEENTSIIMKQHFDDYILYNVLINPSLYKRVEIYDTNIKEKTIIQ